MQWHLAKGLNLPTNKDSLIGHIRLLRAIDSAIIREGVTSLSIADLQQVCFILVILKIFPGLCIIMTLKMYTNHLLYDIEGFRLSTIMVLKAALNTYYYDSEGYTLITIRLLSCL